MSDKKVSVHFDNLPKGELVEVLYLGLFENGATHTLTDEQVTNYEMSSGDTFPESGYMIAGKPVGAAQKAAVADEEGDK